MAIDAVHARNTLQFMFLTLVYSLIPTLMIHLMIFTSFFNALFLLYAAIQIFEIRDSLASGDVSESGISDIPVNVLTTIIPIVISIAEIAFIALGWRIWREFGWKVYKRLGADRQVKRMYAQYQIFVGVMKFDLFFFVGFCVQLIVLVLKKDDWEWYVTCAALPFSLAVLVVGMLAARYENKYMMLSFMLGCGSAMVYFVYKVSSSKHTTLAPPSHFTNVTVALPYLSTGRQFQGSEEDLNGIRYVKILCLIVPPLISF